MCMLCAFVCMWTAGVNAALVMCDGLRTGVPAPHMWAPVSFHDPLWKGPPLMHTVLCPEAVLDTVGLWLCFGGLSGGHFTRLARTVGPCAEGRPGVPSLAGCPAAPDPAHTLAPEAPSLAVSPLTHTCTLRLGMSRDIMRSSREVQGPGVLVQGTGCPSFRGPSRESEKPLLHLEMELGCRHSVPQDGQSLVSGAAGEAQPRLHSCCHAGKPSPAPESPKPARGSAACGVYEGMTPCVQGRCSGAS